MNATHRLGQKRNWCYRPLLWAGIASTRSGGALTALHCGGTGPSVPAGSPDMPWYRRSLVGMEIGPTGAHFGRSDPNDARYAAKFDGRKIVRHAVAADCRVPGPLGPRRRLGLLQFEVASQAARAG